MRKDIEFKTEDGIKLRGWHYLPEKRTGMGAYERALEPKRLVTLTGGHFDAYVKDFEASAGPATEWFTQHLLAK